MIDTGLIVNVVNRTIVNASDLQQVLVLGDNNSQYISFSMIDDFDGVDVLSKNIFIKFINAAGSGDKVAAVDVVRVPGVDGGLANITFGWIVSDKVTMAYGNIAFAIEISGIDARGVYKWSTMEAIILVEKTVDLANSLIIPDQTWLSAYEENLVLSTGEAAESARLSQVSAYDAGLLLATFQNEKTDLVSLSSDALEIPGFTPILEDIDAGMFGDNNTEAEINGGEF